MLAGRLRSAAAAMAGSTNWCTAIPAGIAMTPAASPVPATQHTTMAIVCRGVMPSALNTPRSWTRSRVLVATVLSTPRAATIASSRVRVPISPSIRVTAPDLRPLVMTP